jgi:hypothetical protein
MTDKTNDNTSQNVTSEVDTQAKIVDWVSAKQDKLCNWFYNSGFIDEVCTLLNPTVNHYNISKTFNGRQMDYFGYLAHTLTQWKEDTVFNQPLELRAPSVVFFTALVAWGKT